MSSRKSVVVTMRVPVDGGESPNQYVGEVTVQVRVHYPPLTSFAVVSGTVREATAEVYARLDASMRAT